MKISIGNDHAGVDLKGAIKSNLEKNGHEVLNHGTDVNQSVDYPDFIHPVANDVEKGKAELGIVICGSGNGAAMTANKHPKIRAALCWTKEITMLSRSHNDANIMSIPARFISLQEALGMVDTFISTSFEGERHKNRVKKIPCQ
tara:strand:- start:232 stop:663 length:432 start_codon:yes stop_codon:yes gene_type:complete